MIKCINLCDILSLERLHDENMAKRISAYCGQYSITRFYIGSYFCQKFFLKGCREDALAELIALLNIKSVTLVIPVVSQQDLGGAKKAIKRALANKELRIDEITVNDFGMLYYIASTYSDIPLNLGRLFFKDARDARIPDLYYGTTSISLLSHLEDDYPGFNIRGIEIDCCSSSIRLEGQRNVALHTPLTYVTTGNICKFASIHKEIDQKFRPNSECKMECLTNAEQYNPSKNNTDVYYYRIGRAVYMNNPPNIHTDSPIEREIYFPAKELMGII